MTLTVANTTGDAVTSPLISANIELPDSGSAIAVTGFVQPVGGGAPIGITGTPVTAPAVPGSGSTFWNIAVNTTTGAATVQQSTIADPVPPTGSIVIFRQTLTAGASADLMLDPASTPDTY